MKETRIDGSLRTALELMYAHYLVKKYLNKKYFTQDRKDVNKSKSKGGKD